MDFELYTLREEIKELKQANAKLTKELTSLEIKHKEELTKLRMTNTSLNARCNILRKRGMDPGI